MTDLEFQDLVEQLADDSALDDLFVTFDPDELSRDQLRQLAMFLRSQALLKTEIAERDAFVRRVMIWAGDSGKQDFISDIMSARRAAVLSKKKGGSLGWMVALAACIVAAFSWWRAESLIHTQEATSGSGPTGGALAVLVNEAGAVFKNGEAPNSLGFSPGPYMLEKGLAHLRFINGTDVVLKAPVSFNIENSMRMYLKSGDLRLLVSDTAKGFVVATKNLTYQDLGTEFGVSVMPETGDSSVHVFDGQVDVLDNGGTILKSLTFGNTMSYTGGQLKPSPAPSQDKYPTAGEIGLKRWKDHSNELRKDPSLVAYYSFEQDEANPHILPDVKAHGDPVPAAIHGARWVSGRFPGKNALFFDQDDDHVELVVPGDYTAFTVTTWVLLDRLDFLNNAVFASDGWEPGDFHMNLTDYGKIYGGIYRGTVPKAYSDNFLNTGVWTMLVLAVNQETQTVRGWVNGRLALDSRMINPQGIHPGTCRIGGCRVASHEENPIRSLRGRIDECFVWNRALEQDEVTKLYEAGRPSLLEVPMKQVYEATPNTD